MTLLQDLPGFVKHSEVPAEVFEEFADQIPETVLGLWQRQGLGTAAHGFLKVIDPKRYLEGIGDCLPIPGLVPIFATGLGDIIVYDGEHLFSLQYRYGTVVGVGLGAKMKAFATRLAGDIYLPDVLEWLPYPQAVEMHGPLAYDECFCFTPLLALGGPERAENMTKGDLITHVQLITHLTGGINGSSQMRV